MLNGHMDTVPVGNVESCKFDPFGEIKGLVEILPELI